MRIALVHYWLTNMGGGERALLELHKLYPDAPIYTSVYDPKALPEFKNADVRTTWLQKMPFRFKHQFFGVLRPFAFRSLDLSEYDVVLIADAADAKNVRVPEDAVSFCYCHSPPRYYWSHYDTFLKNPGFGVFDPLARIALKLLIGPLRRIDHNAAQKIDYFAGNSGTIKKRIKKYYDRDAEIVYPPINTKRFAPPKNIKKSGYIHMGRMIGMKRIDIIIEACNQLKRPLTVAGHGAELENLRKIAGPTVTVVDNPSDEEVNRMLQEAEAFIFAAEEDFGIAPIEAMAAGTPVLAYGKAGALETVQAGKTGEFFEQQTVESLVQALKKFDPKKYSRKDLLARADDFSEEAFAKRVKEFVDSKVNK